VSGLSGWRICPRCLGSGWSTENRDGFRNGRVCGKCHGRARIPHTYEDRRRWEAIRKAELTSTLHPPPTLIIGTLTPREGTP
jgi:hypothetical protein